MQTAINSHYSLGFSYSVSCKRHLICLLKCTRNISFPYCFGSARVKRSGASSPWLQVREGPHRHHGWGRMRWRWAHLAQTAGSTAAGTDSDSWLTTQRWAAEMDRWMARGGGRRRWVEVRERDGESVPAYQQWCDFAFLQQWKKVEVEKENIISTLQKREPLSLAGVMGKLVFNSWHLLVILL